MAYGDPPWWTWWPDLYRQYRVAPGYTPWYAPVPVFWTVPPPSYTLPPLSPEYIAEVSAYNNADRFTDGAGI